MTDNEQELLALCKKIMRGEQFKMEDDSYWRKATAVEVILAAALERRIEQPSEREKALVNCLRTMLNKKGQLIPKDKVGFIIKKDWYELMRLLAAYEKEDVK